MQLPDLIVRVFQQLVHPAVGHPDDGVDFRQGNIRNG